MAPLTMEQDMRLVNAMGISRGEKKALTLMFIVSRNKEAALNNGLQSLVQCAHCLCLCSSGKPPWQSSDT